MRIESCTKGRSQTAARLISEYRRGLFPFWGDVLGVFFVCLVKIYDWLFVKHYNLSRENRELKDRLEKMEAGAGELRQELADLREVVFHQQSGAEEEKAKVNLRKILRRLTSVFYTANVWQDLKWQCGGGII